LDICQRCFLVGLGDTQLFTKAAKLCNAAQLHFHQTFQYIGEPTSPFSTHCFEFLKGYEKIFNKGGECSA
jgi:hypothetical protein